jgi:putative phosphonate transport system ATP-binding protein
MQEEKKVLSVRGLHKQFGPGCEHCADSANRADGRTGVEENYCRHCGTVYAVRSVDIDLYEREILGIVGESGSGKTTLMRCLYFDQTVTRGSFSLADEKYANMNLFESSRQVQREIRNAVLGMVYQNPVHGLRMNFSSQANIAEKLIAAGSRRVADMQARAHELLTRVRIPEHRISEPPAQFSGGMQQRVQIAKALSNNPPILFLDEVTTGLDLSVQARVLDLIKEIQREFAVSMLLISHDLSVVRMLADRTVVMLNGKIVEQGLTDQIMEDPQHPYTQELVHSLL